MKARLITILLAALSSVMCFSQTYSTIYTKGGKAIEVIIRPEMSKEEIQQYDEQCRKTFSKATMLSSSSTTYNCHSYTWNLSDGGKTKCWINPITALGRPNIDNYWTNDYYSETTEANAKKIFYYESDHTAIVSETVPGMYESKWGAMPLMRHSPSFGPYLNMDKRKFYNHTDSGSGEKPNVTVQYGVIQCSNGNGEIGVNIAADYYADMPTQAYTSMSCYIEKSKGDDAVEKGYAIINEKTGNSVNVTFSRAGIYEMLLRFYNQSNQLVGEFTYEPIVTE